jgi:uncharacterized membrane protein (DUF2068 family)
MQAGEPAQGRQRPLGVVVIAAFLLIDSGFALVQLVADTPFATRIATLVELAPWIPAAIAVLAITRIVAAVGLWLGYRWAWILTMLAVGVGLLFGLTMYWRGDPSYPRLFLDMVMAFYLNQQAVRRHFEGHTRADARKASPS